jgi:hypothetical protein
MKKVLLMMVLGGAIALTSCSKKGDYTCDCESTMSTNGVTDITSSVSFEYKDQKEEDAKDLCSANESSSNISLVGITSSSVTTCTLK